MLFILEPSDGRGDRWLDQPQFQTGPIGVRVQQGPKLPPL
jgi:hypothetical protein